MEEKFEITVNDLLAMYHDTLLSLSPWINKSMLNVSSEYSSAGKSWIDMCRVLFTGTVYRTLSKSVKFYSFADYAADYANYSKLSYIGVRCKEYEDVGFALVAFCTEKTFLDSVKLVILNDSLCVAGSLVVKNKNLDFRLVRAHEHPQKLIGKQKLNDYLIN